MSNSRSDGGEPLARSRLSRASPKPRPSLARSSEANMEVKEWRNAGCRESATKMARLARLSPPSERRVSREHERDFCEVDDEVLDVAVPQLIEAAEHPDVSGLSASVTTRPLAAGPLLDFSSDRNALSVTILCSSCRLGLVSDSG